MPRRLAHGNLARRWPRRCLWHGQGPGVSAWQGGRSAYQHGWAAVPWPAGPAAPNRPAARSFSSSPPPISAAYLPPMTIPVIWGRIIGIWAPRSRCAARPVAAAPLIVFDWLCYSFASALSASISLNLIDSPQPQASATLGLLKRNPDSSSDVW